MKKIYTLIFLIVFSLGTQAQNYIPFPTGQDSVAWKITETSWGNKYESFIYISNDTLLNGKTYSKVYKGDYLFEDSLNDLILLLREENKRIYIDPDTSGNESLLYNFKLQVNDTLTINSGYLGQAVVKKIDSVKLEDNIYRKRFHFYPTEDYHYDTLYQIEGFGNMYSGFNLPFGIGDVSDYGISVACIFAPNALFYKRNNETEADCQVLKNDVAINDLYYNLLNIYPNPTTNFINFTEKISNTKLSIYNTTGEMLFEEKAFSGTQLDISFLEKGIYFLKLEGELSGFIRLVKL